MTMPKQSIEPIGMRKGFKKLTIRKGNLIRRDKEREERLKKPYKK